MPCHAKRCSAGPRSEGVERGGGQQQDPSVFSRSPPAPSASDTAAVEGHWAVPELLPGRESWEVRAAPETLGDVQTGELSTANRHVERRRLVTKGNLVPWSGLSHRSSLKVPSPVAS